MRASRHTRMLTVLMGIGFAACGGGGDSSPTPPPDTTPRVTSVSIAPPASTILVGGQVQLSATVAVVNGASTAHTWTSSNTTVATVAPSGQVIGVAAGSAIITATSVFDVSKRGTASLTVNSPPAVLSVTVGPASLSLPIGQSGQLTAAVAVENNASTQVLWTSDNSAIATVNATGRVTAVTAGTAKIRATAVADAGKFGESTTTVTAPTFPNAITVDATIDRTFSPGTVDIALGGTVTFSFKALTHNVTFAGMAGAPGNVPNSENVNVARVFGTAGTFTYQCTLHSGMTGTVTVR